MTTPKKKMSPHLQQRVREWFRKAEHELAYPGHSPEVISVEEARVAIEKARAIYAFILRKAQELGYSHT